MDAATPARFLGLNDRRLPGQRILQKPANPSAGADWSATVPGGRMWRVIGGTSVLATSAAVANRFPGFSVTWQGAQWWLMRVGVAITASLTVNVSFGINATLSSVAASGAVVACTSPDCWLPPTSVIGTSTGNISAADQYSAIAFVVEELWLTDEEMTETEDEIERLVMMAESQAIAQQATTPAGG